MTNETSGFFKLRCLTNELRYEAEFLYVIRNHSCGTFAIFFKKLTFITPWYAHVRWFFGLFNHFKWMWSGMPRVNQNNELATSQKWTSYKFDFFCMWLGIHKVIYLIQSIYMGIVRHAWQKKFPVINRHYIKTELSNAAKFLHILSSQTVWFLNFVPKVFSANQNDSYT